jgi:hypothetical protein
MPHLFLPSDHTDADLVLAAGVAAAVSSADLYVTWTLGAGAGTPAVQALVREEHDSAPAHPFAELLVVLIQGVAAVWMHLTGPPPARPAQPGGGRPAGEPSF